MTHSTPTPLAAEPLAPLSDVAEYRAAYEHYAAGHWDDERWTALRLRFGVYGQRQPGVQMVRIKIPGGVLPPAWARAIARISGRYAKGEVHVTTRQDVQIYHVPTAATPALMAELQANGLTTREACGNTLRNMTACAFAGACPRERVDAGAVAQRLARAFLRHPLVQHMPRKFKVSVSGCATDCGASAIHDLGLIAVTHGGKPGFRVYGGGGLGGIPRPAVLLADFVTEAELPAVLEALVRLHQRYSDRVNRNAARIKFLVKRFGEARFRELFLEELERLRALPQRPWEPLAWREPDAAPVPASPGGVIRQHDGRFTVVASLPLGLIAPARLDRLADIAERYAFAGLRATRDQNLAILGIDAAEVQAVIAAVRALGIPVEEAPGEVPNVISCPGTTTCRIGITNAQSFAAEIADLVTGYAPRPGLNVNLSGCQNGCGLHHVADFGFRGMGKKIDGRHAPHYQIYLGGNAREGGAVGIAGPIVPARHARRALELLLAGYGRGRKRGEAVREWARRLGRDGLAALLAPLEKADAEGVYVDWGESALFTPPTVTRAECAAGYALDALFKDLADDGLITVDRALLAGDGEAARIAAGEAAVYGLRRLLVRLGEPSSDRDAREALAARVRAAYAEDARVIAALDALAAAGDDIEDTREALAHLLDLADALADVPVAAARLEALADADAGVLALIGGGGAIAAE